MRTDIKIGIAVGLFVVAVMLVYIVVRQQPVTETGQGEGAGAGAEPARVNEPDFGPDGPGVAGVRVVTSAERPGLPPAEPPEELRVTFEPPEPPPVPAEPREEERVLTRYSPPAPEPEPIPAEPREEPAPIIPETPRGEKIYIVRDGDKGFWGIAQKSEVYGDGKYWYLISKANPNAQSSNLQKGQKLVIPPKPVARPRGVGPVGGLSVDPATGQRVYVVQDGDAGFWGIAQRKEVYGDGRYGTLIAKANPNVDTNNLRPGRRLVIPPGPRAAAVPASRPVGDRTPRLAPGQTIYVVEKGDAGFWEIAEKRYNDGRLWRALMRANPNVDSMRLRPGQKIVIPSLEEARRISLTPSPSSRSVRPPAPAGRDASGAFPRPVFD